MAQPSDHADRGDDLDEDALEKIVRDGPVGAVAVAGVATVIVVAMVIGFYLFIFLPRGILQ
jgi:hypothetical protein